MLEARLKCDACYYLFKYSLISFPFNLQYESFEKKNGFYPGDSISLRFYILVFSLVDLTIC